MMEAINILRRAHEIKTDLVFMAELRAFIREQRDLLALLLDGEL